VAEVRAVGGDVALDGTKLCEHEGGPRPTVPLAAQVAGYAEFAERLGQTSRCWCG
jgi:hypothetical protein